MSQAELRRNQHSKLAQNNTKSLSDVLVTLLLAFNVPEFISRLGY
jgi:hypothetical protein